MSISTVGVVRGRLIMTRSIVPGRFAVIHGRLLVVFGSFYMVGASRMDP
ncbi:MAG: hypothetical protein WBX25_25255 [Rhodomicrobium sp.]